MTRIVVLLLLLPAGCRDASNIQYAWDRDQRVLCSISVDDLSQDAPWDEVDEAIHDASDHGTVALFHAHVPGTTISTAAIDRILSRADANGLAYVTYDELDAPQHPSAGIALCFDDSAVAAWSGQRELLAAHHARVTYFVTRFAAWTDAEHAQLADLAADGHDIEAHGVNHLDAPDYVQEHGLGQYLTDEALPSIAVLEDAGYHPTAYAFPFGASTTELDQALLEHVRHVRVSLGSCPY